MSAASPPPLSSTADPPLPSRAWLIVGLLCVVAALNYLDRVMLTTMRQSVTEAIPMSDARFGLLTTIFLIVYGLCSPFAGFLADRISRSRVIIVSLFLWSLTTYLTAHCTSYWQLFTTRAIMGLSEACYIPAALAMVSEYHRGATRSLAIGIHNSGVCIGSAFGGLGGWLADLHGWAYAFSLFGIIGVVYSVVLLLGLRDAPAAQGDTPEIAAAATQPKVDLGAAVRSLFKEKGFILLMIYWGAMGLAAWAVVGWMPTYLQQQFKLTQGESGLWATISYQGATVLGYLIGGTLSDLWSRQNERGRIIISIIGICIAAPAIFVTAVTPYLITAIAGLIVFGIGRSWPDGNTMPILCMVSDPRYRATGFGIINMFACCVGGVTIYVGGVLRDMKVNVSNLFMFGAFAVLMCGVLLYLIRPRPCPPTPETVS